MRLRLSSLIAALGASILLAPVGAAQEFQYQIFERYLEPLAQQIGMPGLSAVILRNNRVEWEKGYGFADVENKVAARPDTPYPIGGVTQAMTGVLLGICTDRHQLDVDNGIRRWVPAFPTDASVRQVLAHASEGRFVYDAVRYTALTPVVEACMAQPYRVAAAQEILERLAMTSSVPGLDLGLPQGQAARQLFDAARLARYQSNLARVAVPYKIDSRTGNAVRSEYPSYGLDAAAGMVSTARDLASFEAALDNGVPLSSSTLNQMWTGATFGGLTMPTGLGWFVQTSSGQRLVWSYGYIPDAASALILKMPSKRLTLILLANSDGLAAGYNLQQGDIANSPFVKIFLRLFI